MIIRDLLTKMCNVCAEAPSQEAARTLKLVANSLIKLANLTEAKEAYMEVINPFIRDNQQRMVMFLDELSVSGAKYNLYYV